MTKNEVCQAAARRLGCSTARVSKLLDGLHSAGLVKPVKGTRRYPPDCDEHDVTAIVLAVLADAGLESAADNAWRLAAIHGDQGQFDDWLRNLLFGPPRNLRHLIVGPEGVSVTVDGAHITFGNPPKTAARIVPGSSITALAAELQGAAPYEADAIAALIQMRIQ